MSLTQPVLEIESALPFPEESALPNALLELRLAPGACALIETHDPERATAFADLCSGMIPLRQGCARFMGFDWEQLDDERALALRGRIGRIYLRGAWANILRTHFSIMLPQLHHTRTTEASIREQATSIAQRVGLPGLPTALPDRLSDGDLMRASCVRAFLGDPSLLLLESSISADRPELVAPVLDLLSEALGRGSAAICFTRDAPFWVAQSFPVTHRLQLLEDGLRPMRNA